MNDQSISVSIVIPAYNQAKLLARLLESIAAQDYPGTIEVIVVDDCSPDDTAGVTERWIAANPARNGKYIRHEKNAGPGTARNTGLRAARAPIVAFTDTDCVAQPDWLRLLIAPLDLEGGIVGVGGGVLPLDPKGRYARYYALHGTLEPLHSYPAKIPFLITCNCCYLREPLLAVGGFTEDIETPGGEDVAASILLFKAGWRFEFERRALMHHDFRDTFKSFRRTWRNYGYGCAIVAYRHLTEDELHPEGKNIWTPNFWAVFPIRPTITGVRSGLKDMRNVWKHGKKKGLGLPRALESLGLRLIERVSYYRGWKQGVERAMEEKAAQESKSTTAQ